MRDKGKQNQTQHLSQVAVTDVNQNFTLIHTWYTYMVKINDVTPSGRKTQEAMGHFCGRRGISNRNLEEW